MPPTVVVDAENVRRSTWPNVTPVELVERCRAWAAREGLDLRVVFDGGPPASVAAEGDLVGSGSRSADDRIVELAAQLARPIWLVTSDRALRERVRTAPERVIGGGAFLRLLSAL